MLGGDFDLAEEVLHEAFEAAVRQWPSEGVPSEPRAWLLRTARNKAVDRLRRRKRVTLVDDEALEALQNERFEVRLGAASEDDLLRLIFTCCHPALAIEAQVALTLRTLCGLTTEQIARAFLVEEATMAQRLVRAKNKIRVAKIPYIVPERADLDERLDAVLTAIYLVFGEGYAPTSGEALVRGDLALEAIRLGRLLERLMPERAEPVALLALMLLHDSRRDARVDAAGDLVPLEEQDRSRWNQLQIAEGLVRVRRALTMAAPSPYAIQAAIAALHAEAATPELTDWPQIAALYAELLRRAPSPVVALNTAVATAMARGPEIGLAMLEQLERAEDVRGYHLFFAARAELCRRAARFAEARGSYERALELVRTAPERRYLRRRLDQLPD